MLRATLLVVAAAAAAADVASSFVNYGHAVIEDFASPEEIAAMKADMAALEAGYWASNPEGHVFRTDEGQLDASLAGAIPRRALTSFRRQAKSRYFFDSADRVHFFEEAGEQKKLNKAGHGLHLMDNAFGTYSTSDKVKRLLKTLGYRKPVLPQSMYIFKPSEVGGTVTSFSGVLDASSDYTLLSTPVKYAGRTRTRPSCARSPSRRSWASGSRWTTRRSTTAASGCATRATRSPGGASSSGTASRTSPTRRWSS